MKSRKSKKNSDHSEEEENLSPLLSYRFNIDFGNLSDIIKATRSQMKKNKEDIKSLRSVIHEVKDDKASMELTVKALSDKIDQLNATLRNHQSKILELEGGIAKTGQELKTDLSTMATTMQEQEVTQHKLIESKIDDSVISIENRLSTLTKEISNINTQLIAPPIDSYKKPMTMHKEPEVDVSNKLEQLEEALYKEIDALRNTTQDNIYELENKIEEMQNQPHQAVSLEEFEKMSKMLCSKADSKEDLKLNLKENTADELYNQYQYLSTIYNTMYKLWRNIKENIFD